MFDSKEVNYITSTMLMGWLHKLLESSRMEDRELELLAAMTAVITKGYVTSLGSDQAAMIFYSIADGLATDTLDDDEGDDDGDESE